MFDAGPVSRHAQKVVQNETLDSALLETGLCIVMKRMDTGSVWPITNNPAARYWEAAPVAGSNRQHRRANKDYKLWELIRSSTAAPRFFTHKEVAIVDGLDDGASRGKFIDGAVSPHNSPALKMFMMAGIKGYNLGGGTLTNEGGGKAWKLGEDNLFLVSVGTGGFAARSKGGNGAARRCHCEPSGHDLRWHGSRLASLTVVWPVEKAMGSRSRCTRHARGRSRNRWRPE